MSALPIIAAAGAALLLLGGKKSSKSGKASSRKPSRGTGSCPDTIDLDDRFLDSAFATLEAMLEDGERDPFLMTDAIIASGLPKGCSKKDYKTKVRLMEKGKSKPANVINLAAFHGNIVLVVAGAMVDVGALKKSEFMKVDAKVRQDYKKLTGKTMPMLSP